MIEVTGKVVKAPGKKYRIHPNKCTGASARADLTR